MPLNYIGVRTILSAIHSPRDLKNLPPEKLPELAAEIRSVIIDTVSKNGGHLASNLGVVELTIALHRVFDSPNDALVWDVSHQCYVHKLLTGRYDRFSTLRKSGGISGFTKKGESEHDFFDAGHASTSISCALGLLTAWELHKKPGSVVAIIGDGALTGGLAIEALSNAGQLAKPLIVVVNDNRMSIDRNTGALSSYLSRLTMTPSYQTIRRAIDFVIERLPLLSVPLTKFVFRFKRGLKGLLLSNNLFADLGFEYTGPLNGHDERELETVFRRVKDMNRPVVVHVVTKKGRGYSPAEDHPERFHGIGPFSASSGTVEKFDKLSFTEAFSAALLKIAAERPDIVCITAAMAKGTGLDGFARHYPARFFDVGIAEEHAVVFAGGLARGALLPIVCIYSTFMQRAADQIIHDIALQKIHAVFMLDRAGAVPNDGETHQGLFDIALFRPVPNVIILAPASAADLSACLAYACSPERSGQAVIIRYPKASCPSELDLFSAPAESGRGVLIPAAAFAPSLAVQLEDRPAAPRVLFVTTGGMYPEARTAARALLLEDIYADVYSLRFIKPVDTEYFLERARGYDALVIAEDGMKTGGCGEYLSLVCAEGGIKQVCLKAFPDRFYAHGSRTEVLEAAGMSAEDLKDAALTALNERTARKR